MPPQGKTSEFVRLHAQVRGLVQGVNFRWYTRRRAADLGLRGYVRNLADGSVDVVAEGQRGEVDELLGFLRVGPSSAAVEEVDVKWDEPTGEFDRFEVRY